MLIFLYAIFTNVRSSCRLFCVSLVQNIMQYILARSTSRKVRIRALQ